MAKRTERKEKINGANRVMEINGEKKRRRERSVKKKKGLEMREEDWKMKQKKRRKGS